MCYYYCMASQDVNNTLENRLHALEDAVRVIRSELTNIREIFSQGYTVLSDANDNRSRAIQIMARHIEQIEERLEPAFNKLFPQQEEFLRETEAVFDKNRKPQI